MQHPVVSVIMPAFDAVDTLLSAVESVLGQTMAELELIICDDASTDTTSELLGGIDDPRLKYIRNVENVGPGLSRDRAIELATAPWVAMIDADDVWLPERLERLLEAVKGQAECMVFDDIVICHTVAGRLVRWRPVHGIYAFGGRGALARDLRIEDYVGAPRLLIQPMIPLAAIRRHNLRHTNRSFGEDAEYFLRLALVGVRFRYLPEPLYLYRVQPGSATARAGLVEMRECIEDCSAWDGWPNSVKDAFSRKIASLRLNETLYAMAQSARSGQFLSVLKYIVSNPAVLRILPRRLVRYLAYQAHRLRHGGAGRHSRSI